MGEGWGDEVGGRGRKKRLSRHLLQEGDISYPELEWGWREDGWRLWRMGGGGVGWAAGGGDNRYISPRILHGFKIFMTLI